MNQHNRTVVLAIGAITALGPAVPVTGIKVPHVARSRRRNQPPEMSSQ
jgi:hypothetical protein